METWWDSQAVLSGTLKILQKLKWIAGRMRKKINTLLRFENMYEPAQLLAIISCLLFIVSCAGTRMQYDLKTLEAGVSAVSIQAQGSQYYISCDFDPRLKKRDIIRLIKTELISDEAKLPDLANSLVAKIANYPPLPNVDIWALILSDMTNKSLHIFVSDSYKERDEEIQRFLGD